MAKAIRILLAVIPGVMLALLLLRPVWDVDVFWQLKLGELLLAKGGPLAREPFAAAHLGDPLPSFAWLGQAIMAEIRALTGWTGLRIFDALCWLGGFLAVAWACRARGAANAGLALGLVLAFVVALPVASLRPQSFAALCFGLLLALLHLRLSAARTALFAVPLLLLWQNLHPSVSVALLPLGVRTAETWLRTRRLPWGEGLLVAATVAAMFATPEGFAIFAWSAANAAESAMMGVSEWLPLWDPVNRTVAVPVIAVALVVAWLAWSNRSRIDLGELMVAAVLLGATLVAYRFVLFWAIALVPLVARAMSKRNGEGRVPGIAVALGLLAAVVLTPILRPTHFSPSIPLAAIDSLRGVRGTVFAHFPWGGAVIDRGYPDRRVAFDGRFYRYSPEEWTLYRSTRTDPASLAAIEQRYRPAAFVLDPEWNAALVSALRVDRGHWREVSVRDSAIVFIRLPEPPAAIYAGA